MTRWLGAVVVPVVVIVALGTLIVADAASAQPPGGRGARAARMGRRLGPPLSGQLMHLRSVDLSEAQREQIRTIHEQNGEATQAANERVRVARRALHDAVTADVVNEGAIHAVASELGLAEGDAAVQQAYVHAQVWQLLTPQQQEQARAAETRWNGAWDSASSAWASAGTAGSSAGNRTSASQQVGNERRARSMSQRRGPNGPRRTGHYQRRRGFSLC